MVITNNYFNTIVIYLYVLLLLCIILLIYILHLNRTYSYFCRIPIIIEQSFFMRIIRNICMRTNIVQIEFINIIEPDTREYIINNQNIV